MKKYFLQTILIFVVIFSACDSDDITNIDTVNNPFDNLSENIPVVVNNENSFTFALRANKIDFSYTDNLSFSSDSLVITITSLKTSSVNSSFFVYDNLNEVIFSETLNQNKVIVKSDIGGKIPKKANIRLINYSGELTIVVANKHTQKNYFTDNVN